MDVLFQSFIFPLLLAFGVSLLSTPLTIKLANKFGLVDDPKKHKHEKVTHQYPVPRGGGLPILLALISSILFFLPLDQHVSGILIGAIVVVAVGLIDDRWNISPYWRLFGGNLLAALIVVGSGIGIAFLSNPLSVLTGQAIIDLSHPQIVFNFLGAERSIWILADAFAVIWIIGLMNIVGIGAGGVEGQYPGVVGISALTIALLSLRFSADIAQWPVITLAAITAGAYFGFLPWNFFPQKIMPGYSGKSLGGFLLAVLAILSTTKVGTALVVLGIPIMDVSWSIIRRLSQKKSPVWGDRGHLHHKLLDKGWSKRQIAIFYWTVTAVLGYLALQLNSSQKLYTIIGIGFIVGSILLWLTYWLISSKPSGQDSG